MKKLLMIGAVATVTLAPAVLMAGTMAHWTFGANGLTDITGNNVITLENHGVTFSGFIDDVRITEGALEPSAFMKADERTEVLPGLIIKMM